MMSLVGLFVVSVAVTLIVPFTIALILRKLGFSERRTGAFIALCGLVSFFVLVWRFFS